MQTTSLSMLFRVSKSQERETVFPAARSKKSRHFFEHAEAHKLHAAGDNKDVGSDKVVMGTWGPRCICQSHTCCQDQQHHLQGKRHRQIQDGNGSPLVYICGKSYPPCVQTTDWKVGILIPGLSIPFICDLHSVSFSLW